MKQIILTVSLLMLYIHTVSAQATGNQYYESAGNAYRDKQQIAQQSDARFQNDNVMLFNVHVLKNVEASEYVAIFNMTQVGKTADEVNSLMNTRFEGFKKAAKQQGLDEKDIVLDMVSFIPVYEYEVEKKIFSKSYNEVPKGFELQKNIHVRYKDKNKLNDLVTIAAKNEIYDLVKVDYTVNNPDQIYLELQTKAIEFLNKKLTNFQKLGIRLDTVYRVITDKNAVFYPNNRYSSYEAHSSTSVDNMKKRSSVSKARKPKTIYYDKLPYENFDVVINPTVLEPAVQYTYNLQVKFIIKTPAKKLEKQFYLLSPDGNMKLLKVD